MSVLADLGRAPPINDRCFAEFGEGTRVANGCADLRMRQLEPIVARCELRTIDDLFDRRHWRDEERAFQCQLEQLRLGQAPRKAFDHELEPLILLDGSLTSGKLDLVGGPVPVAGRFIAESCGRNLVPLFDRVAEGTLVWIG